jgi:hypothetical protein
MGNLDDTLDLNNEEYLLTSSNNDIQPAIILKKDDLL